MRTSVLSYRRVNLDGNSEFPCPTEGRLRVYECAVNSTESIVNLRRRAIETYAESRDAEIAQAAYSLALQRGCCARSHRYRHVQLSSVSHKVDQVRPLERISAREHQ